MSWRRSSKTMWRPLSKYVGSGSGRTFMSVLCVGALAWISVATIQAPGLDLDQFNHSRLKARDVPCHLFMFSHPLFMFSHPLFMFSHPLSMFSRPREPFFPLGHPGSRQRGHTGELPPELLRVGIELADGPKATTLDPHPFMLGPDATPEDPLLTQNGGHGGGSVWRLEFWLRLQPPPGPLVFACEWPSEGVELTRIKVDASAAIEAASRAEVLWPEEGGGPGGSAGSYQIR